MGPYTKDVDPMFAAITRLHQLQEAHPEAIVTRPSESSSGLWELSLPGRATLAVDSVEKLAALLEEESC